MAISNLNFQSSTFPQNPSFAAPTPQGAPVQNSPGLVELLTLLLQMLSGADNMQRNWQQFAGPAPSAGAAGNAGNASGVTTVVGATVAADDDNDAGNVNTALGGALAAQDDDDDGNDVNTAVGGVLGGKG